MDDVFLRTAVDAGERWYSRVGARRLLVGTVATTTAVAVATSFLDVFRRNLPQPTVLVTAGLVAAATTALLLWLRSDVLDDERLGWVAPGYVVASLLMLLSIEQIPGVLGGPGPFSGGAPADTLDEMAAALDRGFALHLFWHLSFAGASLGGLLLERHTLARRTFLTTMVAVGVLVAATGLPTQLHLVDLAAFRPGRGLPFTVTYWVLAGTILALLVAAAVTWCVRGGSHPPVARAWVGATLVLVAIELAFQMLGGFDVTFAITAVTMQALAFLVALGGQVVGLRTTIAGQLAFEQDVARRLMADTDNALATTDLLLAEVDVRRVLSSGDGLAVHLQPIVALADGSTVGFEALARFASTSTGEVHPPDRWFAAAEALGLGVELELLAAERALALLPHVPLGAYLAVNVGPRTLLDPRLLELLRSIPAERVVLELTEHAAIDDYAAVADALVQLRTTGCQLAVDDAGAGFSSLRHITRLAPNVVKLDVSLVRGVDRLPLGKAMVAALVAYAERAGARLVAEGVETAAEANALTNLGVGHGQGWHWGRAAAPTIVLGGTMAFEPEPVPEDGLATAPA